MTWNFKEIPQIQWSLVVIHDLNFAAGAKDLTLSLNLGPISRSKTAMTGVKEYYMQRYNF